MIPRSLRAAKTYRVSIAWGAKIAISVHGELFREEPRGVMVESGIGSIYGQGRHCTLRKYFEAEGENGDVEEDELA